MSKRWTAEDIDAEAAEPAEGWLRSDWLPVKPEAVLLAKQLLALLDGIPPDELYRSALGDFWFHCQVKNISLRVVVTRMEMVMVMVVMVLDTCDSRGDRLGYEGSDAVACAANVREWLVKMADVTLFSTRPTPA